MSCNQAAAGSIPIASSNPQAPVMPGLFLYQHGIACFVVPRLLVASCRLSSLTGATWRHSHSACIGAQIVPKKGEGEVAIIEKRQEKHGIAWRARARAKGHRLFLRLK